MSGHENALTKALIAALREDATLQALVGDRIWERVREDAGFPQLLIGRGESRPVTADGGGVEHRLTLSCASRFNGLEEARAVAGAARARLDGARVEADGVRTVSLNVTFVDAFRSGDGQRAWAVIRLRAVTEEVAGDE